MTGLWLALAVMAVAAAFGLIWRAREGRVRTATGVGPPELAGMLGVRATPTTLAVTRSGHELFRVAGVPRRDDLLSALQPHL